MKRSGVKFIGILMSILVVLLSLVGLVQANPYPQVDRVDFSSIISYQGQVWDGTTPYDGKGYFKFAIKDSSDNIVWSNDGLDPPDDSVTLTVTNGLFNILLGDVNIGMQPLEAKVFEDSHTTLAVWFSADGSTWTPMPDQEIAAVPYAFHAQQAQQADDANSLGGHSTSYFQARVTGTCPDGQAIQSINADGSVVCVPTLNKPIYNITAIDSVGNVGDHNAITIGSDGLGIISYMDLDTVSLKVAHCENIACTEATVSTIDTVGDVGYSTAITIGRDGLAIISYYDNYHQTLKVAHCDNLACTSANVESIADVGGSTNQGTSITVDKFGVGLISYYDAVNQDLRLARCGNEVCSVSLTYLIESTNNVGNYSSIMRSTGDYALIAHTDLTNYDLHVSYISLLNYTTKGTTIVDSTNNTGVNPSMTRGPDGYQLISYSDLTSEVTKVAHCTNETCTDSTVENLISFWGDPFISLGSDRLPVISLADPEYNRVIVIKCYNNDCTEGGSWQTVGIGLGEPITSSITIGMDGYPLISYYDQTHGNLVVAHCSDVNCQPYFRQR